MDNATQEPAEAEPGTGASDGPPLQRSVTVCNPKGLHARAAARLATLASGLSADVQVRRRDATVSARSIMGLMMLAASQGTAIDVIVCGPGAEAALQQVCALVEDGFGELDPS